MKILNLMPIRAIHWRAMEVTSMSVDEELRDFCSNRRPSKHASVGMCKHSRLVWSQNHAPAREQTVAARAAAAVWLRHRRRGQGARVAEWEDGLANGGEAVYPVATHSSRTIECAEATFMYQS